ncbi:MAG: insulinase family protein [Solobacterium sp.]|nr:insulinase family protein [Solobacterium sp.]MCH4222224.1 insulinase family protein [Solobacterium sp.]MCH4265744.1 insulinase family protein [Solobacterium sp.]
MNQITDRLLNETYMEEVLPNGLDVIVWHKPLFTSSHVMFATPYGSLDREQTDPAGVHYQFPAGIAHFLEHKLFESDERDVMEEFSRLGANVNAYTSFEKTACYFETAAGDISAPLNLLLDFVQDFSVSEASVEKEKPIIIQELNGYRQDPVSRLDLETFNSMYQNHPIRYDICGDEASIKAITKAQLEQCYQLNYHPGRMMLVAVTPSDPAMIIDLVRKNQAAKTFALAVKLERYTASEPLQVIRTQSEVNLNLSEPRVCIGIKLPVIQESDKQREQRDWAVKTSMDAWFSSVNPDYQKWLDQGLISSYFSYESDFSKDMAMILFYDRTKDAEGFRSFIENQLPKWQSAKIKESTVAQLRNRGIGTMLHLFNHPSDIARTFFDCRMKGISLSEEYQIISSLSCETLKNAVSQLDLSQRTITIEK